jgi:UDP-N-acetylglucosamine 2-epimerase
VRILVALGTRSEIIKLAPVCRALERADVELDVLWSGQHIELAADLLDLFEIRVTCNGCEIAGEPGLGSKLDLISRRIEQLLHTKDYDWIVVEGDTVTAAAATAAGSINNVPVAHVGAGLRTGDRRSPPPEEFNRRLGAVASTAYFAPTAGARDNLLREGAAADRVVVAGNTVVDALLYMREKMRNGYRPTDKALAALPSTSKLVLAALRRRETVGEPLRNLLRALRTLGTDGDKLIVLPVHPDPPVRAEVMSVLRYAPNVWLLDPLQYADFVYVLSRAWVVVSASGEVQEEAPTFGLPILIPGETAERPEVVEAGFGALVGSDYQAIVAGVRTLTAGDQPHLLPARNPFGRGDSSEHIAARLASGPFEGRQSLLAAE